MKQGFSYGYGGNMKDESSNKVEKEHLQHRIYLLKVILHELEYDNNVPNEAIIIVSQQLDILISEYMLLEKND